MIVGCDRMTTNVEIFTFWVNILLPVLSILIPVMVTIYTVNNRIKSQQKENHQPYVVLDKIVDIDKLNEFSYHLTPIGKNYLAAHPEDEDYESINESDICVKLALRNIGYGVASNIKFYNLLTGLQIHGTQASNLEQNQKLFTTLDMQAGEEKGIQARILNLVIENDGMIEYDHIRMFCIYCDLNQNTYNFIISINAKSGGHYDFFAYQPSSKSYRKWSRENAHQIKQILKDYRN